MSGSTHHLQLSDGNNNNNTNVLPFPPGSEWETLLVFSDGRWSDTGGLFSLIHPWPRLPAYTTRVFQEPQSSAVPTTIKNGVALYRGAVKVQQFGEEERSYINSKLRHQNAYDSVDIVSRGKPVVGGIDLSKTPQIAGVIDQVTSFAGVRPDTVHITTREGGQLHTSHFDRMKFDARLTVHLGAGTLLRGQSDPNNSTGDFVLSGGDLPHPFAWR